MSASLKYRNLLRRLISRILLHEVKFGFLALFFYYNVFGLFYIGIPAVAFVGGRWLFGPNGALLVCIALPPDIVFIVPVLVVVLVLLFERVTMFLGIYRLFDIDRLTLRTLVGGWSTKNT